MPTGPLEKMLHRDLAKVEGKAVIDIASPLLQELVNFATNALARCADQASREPFVSALGAPDVHLPSLALYRHTIELTDGVEVLIAQSCPGPAIPLVRGSFEDLLAIEYIVQKNYEQRSLSWLAKYYRNRIAIYESLDPATARGQSIRPMLERDTIGKVLDTLDVNDSRAAAATLRKILSAPEMERIQAAFPQRGNKDWYSLFGGPGNLEQLADSLRRGAQYTFLYRRWSSITHGHDLSRVVGATPEGESGLRVLRDPNEIGEIARIAAGQILDATRLVLSKFRPGENIGEWYMREVRTRYLRLGGSE